MRLAAAGWRRIAGCGGWLADWLRAGLTGLPLAGEPSSAPVGHLGDVALTVRNDPPHNTFR